jgi:putative CocE/NonD family hydrolase
MYSSRRFGLPVILFVVSLSPCMLGRSALAQGAAYIKEHYTKYEYRITMRDGVRLFTSVYVPKDTSRKYPIMISRTPYSVAPYGVDAYKDKIGPSELFAREGYIVVYQDVRGKMMSEGEFVNMRPYKEKKSSPSDIDESSDTYDTIDWLIKNIPGHNGKVGMWGISYPGFYTAAGMIDAHPALKAASPQAPVTDWFTGDDWHHNGAFLVPHAVNFLNGFGRPRPEPTTKRASKPFDYGTPDGYAFFLKLGPLSNVNRIFFKDDVAFWNEIMSHATFDDFWKARNVRQHLKNIKPAVMSVGGWFDAENLFGAVETYRHVERLSPDAKNVLVMGPWSHGGWQGDGASLGPIPFHSRTGAFFREQIEFPFFQAMLKGVEGKPIPEAWVFETGTNEWRTFDTWPPRLARKKSIYLQPGGSLGFEAPAKGAKTFDEYVSDPARPVPYLDQPGVTMAGDYMVQDQRVASRRPDVLVYEGSELAQDVTLTGQVEVRFFVSTSGTDSDWIVKLIDVYPGEFPAQEPNPKNAMFGGYQQLVRGDVMRGKFRESLSDPKPFVPNEPTELRFAMPDIQHCFRTGHRIMIQVQSTWFPLIDRNPQTFVDIYKAKEADFQKATQRVYFSPELPSRLEVRELVR